MNKTVDRTLTQNQWEDLQYPISLRALTESEGGGWFANIPLLGEATCAADGETVEEALANLEEYRRSLYEVVIASKHPIPLPTAVTEKEVKPAGKWLMRASSELHAKLQKGSEEAGVSFNTYCLECLSRGHDAHAAENAVIHGMATLKNELIRELSDKVRDEVHDEMRRAAQDVVDELSYHHARQTLSNIAVGIQAPEYSVSTSQTTTTHRPLCLVNDDYQIPAAA